MATFAIGDIHGTSGALKTLFDLKIFTDQDIIVFLGDYVDRGPDVKNVINQLIAISSKFNVVFLMGNHEIMMLQSRHNRDLLPNWLINGGTQTLDSYGIGDDPNWQKNIPQSHWNFLENGRPYYVKEDFIFVHAGLESGTSLVQQDKLHLFWKKYEQPVPFEDKKTVICGHTSRKNGLIADFGHTICIDTFAWGGQWLTCMDVETLQYWQTRENGELRTGSLDQ